MDANERFVITRAERDEIWKELQQSNARSIAKAVDEVMFSGEGDDRDKIKRIRDILADHKKRLERFDRLLHGGKTEVEERKEFFDRVTAEHKERDEGLDAIMEQVFGGNPFKAKR